MDSCMICGVVHQTSGALNPDSAGIDFKSSESDVCRRQILTSEVDPRTVRVKIFLMAEYQ